VSGSGYIGDAAEFFVASECSRRGWKCSVVKGNAPSCDLIVANPDTSEAKVIEVKATTSKTNVRWNIDYVPDSNDLIYVLVHFKGEFSQHWESESFKPERPEVYILTIQEMKKLWSEDSGSYNNPGIKKSSLKPRHPYREKWTKIFDDGMPDGFSSRSFKSQLWDRAKSEAAKELKHSRNKDKSWRKGWDGSVYWTKLMEKAKKHHRRLKKEINEKGGS